MKNKCLILLLTLCVGLVLCHPALAAEGIKDVNGHWAQVQIEKWVTEGLIVGYPDGKFKPDDSITRAEFVSMVNQAFKIKKNDKLYSFSDVLPADWFFEQVMSGKEAGYITGYPDGTFKPNHNISRQETAVVITKLLSLSSEGQTSLGSFVDYLSMDQWAQASIYAVTNQGIMSGFPDKTFKAQKNITRAEAVVALNRSLSYLQEEFLGIKGIVKLDNQPVEGATVRVFAGDSQEPLKDTVTGKNGAFSFAVPEGVYQITALQDRNVGYASQITVNSTGITGDQEIVLTQGVSVSGTIMDDHGNPLANLPIAFTTNPTFMGSSDNNGKFSVVLPGTGKDGQSLFYSGYYFYQGVGTVFASNLQFSGDTDLGQMLTNIPGKMPAVGGGGGGGSSGNAQPTDNTPPSVSSASVNGNTLLLTFNENLDWKSTPLGADFSVTVNGSGQAVPINVSILDAQITITLAEAVKPGDTVTISYTPGANPIQDLAGNKAIVLVDKRVESNSSEQPEVPEIDRTVATNLFASTAFLYSGDNPVQIGMAADTIEQNRAAVIRGQVLTLDGAPLPEVHITVLNHPEFGSTVSGPEGFFDMAVNGGSLLTVCYEKEGYIAAQRQVEILWQDFTIMPEVVIIPYDSNKTAVNLTPTSPIQVARGSKVTDVDGTRQATLIIPPGVTAKLQDGTPISNLTVRATEYTVGTNGPQAMPAILPPNVGYTYCVEYSADEVVAAGSKSVIFDQPIYHYVENFIGFPVGGIVPMGYYDYDQAAWIPSQNGRVIKIIGINDGGLVELDIDGLGVAADAESLGFLGITATERQKLTAIYEVGQELWRVPITHFTPWDCNWPIGPPENARGPRVPMPEINAVNDPCRGRGSIIEYQNQALGERATVYGTSFSLNYNSSRVEGNKQLRSVEIPISGSELPDSLKEIILEVKVAGQFFRKRFDPVIDQRYTYIWDGKNSYGQRYQGSTPIYVRIGYVYHAVYANPLRLERFFGGYGEPFPIQWQPNRENLTFTAWQDWTGTLSNWDSSAAGIGGWSLDVHHAYVPNSRMLYLGDGSRRDAESSQNIISTVAGTAAVADKDGYLVGAYSGDNDLASLAQLNRPFDVAAGPDGSLFIADGFNQRIRKISPEGIITTIAGNPTGNELDNGPARMIKIGAPMSIALGPDGSIYFSENARHRIRRVSKDGIISVIAGTGAHGLNGDGGPASKAQLNSPGDIAVAADGSIYIADTNNHRIRRIDPNGIISTIAGIGTGNDGGDFGGDGWLASEAKLRYPKGVAIGPDGGLYIADSGNDLIRRIGIDGIINTVTVNGWAMNSPSNLDVTSDGTLFVVDYSNHRILRITPDGTVSTVAGTGFQGYSGDGDISTEAQLTYPCGVAFGPDGSLYIADTYNHRIRRVGQPSHTILANEYLIPDQGGSKLFAFNVNGRHLRTINALTGSVIYTFTYDEQGQLTAVTDVFGNVTTIERDGAGKPTKIIAPGGQKTYLSVNENNYLSSISCPYEIPINLAYTNDNLLTMFSDHKGNIYHFSYDDVGRLIKDEDPVGGYTQLAHTQFDNGYKVNVSTANGLESSYEVKNVPGVGTRRVDTDSSGGVMINEINDSGTRKVTYPDGTVATMVTGPDPRPGIGMRAPITREFIITTPEGLISKITRERSVEFADEDTNNLFAITKITDTLNKNGKVYTTTYERDMTNQKVIVTDVTPENRQRINTLDWYGRIIESISDGLEPTSYSYDAQGRLISVRQGEQSISYEYDAMNRLISLEDAEGARFQYTYNDADVLKSITMPGGQTYTFSNDYNGNVTEIIMPSGAVHKLGYSAIDKPESYTPPGNNPYQKTYDKDQVLTQVKLPDGREVAFTYDDGGRITGIGYDEQLSAFVYADSTDRVASISRNPDGTSYFYDYDGALITGMSARGEVTGNYSYRYGDDLNLMGFTLDATPEVTLAYDNDGLLTQYGEFRITHEGPLGAPSEITGGAMTTTYTYDTYGRLANRSNAVGGKSIYALDITYDNTGIIKARREQVDDLALNISNYTYDENKQLTGVTGNTPEAYRYDINGNRQSGGAVYDAQDRLNQLGDVNYHFNEDGFLTRRGSDIFNYTAQGELQQATAAGREIFYTYDGLGRRISRYINTGTEEAPLIEEEQYLYGNLGEPFQITALRDHFGNLSQYYYDQSNCLFAIKQSDTWYYVATDQQGTPRVVSDADGTLIKVMEYTSYGKLISDSNPAFQLPIGYAGGISDPDTGLVHFGMRDYDPDAGSWTARDPILFDGYQGNLYVYVGNNPVNLRDPSGLFCIGGSAYAGFGGGGQFCVTGEGVSLCAEVGFGIGTSVELNPFQGLAGNSSEVGIQMGIGPASGELVLDDCGNLKFTAGLGVGPFSKSASYDFLDKKWAGNDISVGIDPTDFLGSNDSDSKAKIDVKAKIYGKKCMVI